MSRPPVLVAGWLAVIMALATATMMLPLIVVAAVATMATAAGTVPCGGGPGQSFAGMRLDAEQLGHAQTIVTVTVAMRLPPYAATVALATAYQESRLRNSAVHTDHGSEGLFQQRVSIYTHAVAIDPVRATHAFLTRMVRVPGWQTIPLTDAAQAVQRSATPDAYARWQPLAANVTGLLWPTAAATVHSPAAGTEPAPIVPPGACTGQGGDTTQGGTWVRPAVGPLSSTFGPRWGSFHAGVDIAAPYGSVIRAASRGRVTLARWYGGYGNAVEVDHGGGLSTRYGHASALLVTAGEYVTAGQPLARVGSTGDASGPHLHFEVRVRGAAIDPLPFMRARGVGLG
jgi:murein DD-endopeptidase MepM/ murein hydrolase activator NlpD